MVFIVEPPKKIMEPHVGGTLRKLLKLKKMKAADLAELLGVSERSVHTMCRKKYLHSKIMMQISEVLDHNIFQYLYLRENQPIFSRAQKIIDDLKEENTRLKKENEMLERMVRLVEKM